MSKKIGSPSRNTGYITRHNSKGQTIVIPVGFSRGINALRHYARNRVEYGAFVDANNYGANPTHGVISITDGAIVQEGFLRRISAAANLAIPADVRHVGFGTSPDKIAVYVPPVATTDGTYIDVGGGKKHFKLNSEFVTPTFSGNITGSKQFPTVPDGSVVLAHIYYNTSGGATTVGPTVTRSMIDNNAKPKLFEPQGVWYN